MITFAQFLLKKRNAAQMSQRAVANAMGVSQSHYANIERGAHKPSRAVTERAFEALLATPEEIAGIEPIPRERERKHLEPPIDPSELMPFGLLVRQKRLAGGWTLLALATQARMTESHVSYIERNLQGYSPDVFARLCTALEITPEEILRIETPKASALRREAESIESSFA